MWYEFFLQNAHFGINTLTALVLFSISWLYFDAWVSGKTIKDGVRTIGFIVLSISFLFNAVLVESNLLNLTFLHSSTYLWLMRGSKTAGYFIIVISLLIDPLQPRPVYSSKSRAAAAGLLFLSPLETTLVAHVVLAATAGFLYFWRASIGLEKHLKSAAYGLGFLALAEFFGLATIFRETQNTVLYQLVAPFGPLWLAEHTALLIGMIILGIWISNYLLERLITQFFIIFTFIVVLIFIITSVTFSFLLVRNIQKETLHQIDIDAKVLQYTFESKKAETLADADILAQNPTIQQALQNKQTSILSDQLESFLLTKKHSTLIIVDTTGKVIARGEDRERIGDTVSDDPLIKRSLTGERLTSVVSHEGVLAPEVLIKATSPITVDGRTIGTVVLGAALDAAFVDGVKTATGLDVSVYGDNKLSATTLTGQTHTARPVGIEENSPAIKTAVFVHGESYQGTVNFLSRPYFAAYVPLLDLNNIPVGMLFIGKPQIAVLETAAQSIESTFIVSGILLVISMGPLFLLARNLSKQFR